MPPDNNLIHTPIEEVYKQLGTGPEGLSSHQALKRQTAETFTPPSRKWCTYISEFEIVILASIIISVVFGKLLLSTILLCLFLIELLVFARERRIIKVLNDGLEILRFPSAWVYRDKKLKQINWNDCVKGDVVEFYPYSRIYADVRIIESARLVIKTTSEQEEVNPHFIRSGSTVLSGWGKGVILQNPNPLDILDHSCSFPSFSKLTISEWLVLILSAGSVVFTLQNINPTVFKLPALLLFASFPFIYRVTRLLLSTHWGNLFLSYGLLPGNNKAINKLNDVDTIAFPTQGIITTGNLVPRRIYANCERILYSQGNFSSYSGKALD